MNRVKLSGTQFSLRRERDGAGDSGQMLKSLSLEIGGQIGEEGEIIVGCCLHCGSTYARSYSSQDHWTTTPVAEILWVSDDKREAKIRTENGSVYTVKS